jgi:hypothetical protein
MIVMPDTPDLIRGPASRITLDTGFPDVTSREDLSFIIAGVIMVLDDSSGY